MFSSHSYVVIACSHRRHGQDKTISFLGVKTIEDKTRQFCLVSTKFPISNFSVVLDIFETEQLQIRNCVETRQNVLSCCQFCSHRRHGQNKTRFRILQIMV